MSRSYLFIPRNNLNMLADKNIILADAVVIDIYDYQNVLSTINDFEKIIESFKEHNVKLYLKLDSLNLKETYKILNTVSCKHFDGWLVPSANRRTLNRLTMKARDYEVQKRINYGSVTFIAMIDTPNGVLEARSIANYDRVTAIGIDGISYLKYLGIEDSNNSVVNYLRQQISIQNGLSKKMFIDTFCGDDAMLEEDIEIGRQLGCFAKATTKLEQVPTINQAYVPSENEIEKAKAIVEAFRNAPDKKTKRHLMLNEEYISENQVIRSNYVLERVSSLSLEDIAPLDIMVVDEKIKKVKPYNIMKFYSMGEEIGNAVTHGVGIVLGLVFLILLIIKIINNHSDVTTILAYVTYAISAICLYFMSTMYHGLPTGSAGKRLFQRFDHMTIYLLIAGTYTPYSLLALGGTKGTILCIYLWTGAIIGLLLNLFFWGRFRLFHMILYVMLGWTAILFIPELFASLGVPGVVLLIAGGLSYTLGIIFYSLKLFKYTHMIWHLFVLVGTILHFLSIYLYL